MELSELVSYARDKYQIEEQHKWAEFPGFSVLVHPQTGHWVALLMRQWDSDLGEVVERCDLKCGEQTLSEFPLPYLSRPIRMPLCRSDSAAGPGSLSRAHPADETSL